MSVRVSWRKPVLQGYGWAVLAGGLVVAVVFSGVFGKKIFLCEIVCVSVCFSLSD